jgi:hypothetical protein
MVKILKKKLILDDLEVFDCLNQMTFNEHKVVVNGRSSYTSHLIINDNKILNLIVNEFIDMAGEGYKLLEIWANKYSKGGYVKEHSHIPTIEELKNVDCKAGVYFFKKPKMSGDFVLDGEKQNIEEGDILLFDCDKKHYSLPNETNEDRIVFSINIAKGVEKLWNNNKWEFKRI